VPRTNISMNVKAIIATKMAMAPLSLALYSSRGPM